MVYSTKRKSSYQAFHSETRADATTRVVRRPDSDAALDPSSLRTDIGRFAADFASDRGSFLYEADATGLLLPHLPFYTQ